MGPDSVINGHTSCGLHPFVLKDSRCFLVKASLPVTGVRSSMEPHVIMTLVSGSTTGADFRQGVEVGKEIGYFVSVSSLQR
jgi:hypothetical protein